MRFVCSLSSLQATLCAPLVGEIADGRGYFKCPESVPTSGGCAPTFDAAMRAAVTGAVALLPPRERFAVAPPPAAPAARTPSPLQCAIRNTTCNASQWAARFAPLSRAI